jgi:pimeloyl-ACP methyl ester carboxylesterase
VCCGSRVCLLRALIRGSKLVGMGMPETRYARSGDVMIAYQVLGEGPFDVVFVPGTVSHVELQWELEGWAALLRAVAGHVRVLVFDKRGTGLSDRVAGAPTLEQRSDDIRAVMDTAGSQRAALFGVSEGVPMGVVFAASHPERVSALVLYGGMARTLWAPDYLFGYTEREYRKTLEDEFDAFVTPGSLEGQVRSGCPSASEAEVRALARIFRYGSSPSAIEALERMNMAIDVRDVLPVISAPTLVVHQRSDPWVRAERGRYLAQHIPGAAYVELDSGEHIPTAATAPQLLAEMMPFLQEAAMREAPEPDKVLATILFSDIVGSTAKAAELGTRAGGNCWPPTMGGFAPSWPGSGGSSSTRPGTGFSPGSMGRPARSVAPWRFIRQYAASACRSASACTPASARCSMARWPGSRSRSAHGCPRGPEPVKCWYPRRSKT